MAGAERGYRETIKRLAALHGVQPAFTDASGIRRTASLESMARVLAALGSPAESENQASQSELRRLADLDARLIEPVTPAWAGRVNFARLAVPDEGLAGRLGWRLSLENGSIIEGVVEASSLQVKVDRTFEGLRRPMARLPFPKGVPQGYHRLTIEHAGRTLSTTVIFAPQRSFAHPAQDVKREWGVFAPVYSLRSERTVGCGDLTDLESLASWSHGLGGRVVSTLPMLAAFLGERPGPFDPSPYAPASRLFWNELFVDPERAPEFQACAEAKKLVSSAEYRKEAARLAKTELVDYRGVATLKRRVMEVLARAFFAGGGERSEAFASFMAENPLAREYASFRAMTEFHKAAWDRWPAGARQGTGGAARGEADEATRYHLYAQYVASLQLHEFSRAHSQRGGLVYLDLPVGVSPWSFDVYRNPRLFAMGCSTGAPPDPYFTGGQDWGFPPLHPETGREDAYAYFIACLRTHMRYADYLRLDHVMAFHRLYCIPSGMRAADGVYVSYQHEELYAVLCLESHRNRCRLVGENLGTVPPAVNKALADHDLCGLFVGQYEMQPTQPALRAVPGNCVASVNTHDMAPMAATWSGRDVDDRIALGQLDPAKRSDELAHRERVKAAMAQFLSGLGLLNGKVSVGAVRDALLKFLAKSAADFVLVNIEDLWLETLWQNVPGTMNEHPNWRRKLKLTLDELRGDRAITRLLGEIQAQRAGAQAVPALKTKATPAPKAAAAASTKAGAQATPSKPAAVAAARTGAAKAAAKSPAKVPAKAAAKPVKKSGATSPKKTEAKKKTAKKAAKKTARAASPKRPAAKVTKKVAKKVAKKPVAKKKAGAAAARTGSRRATRGSGRR